MKGEILKKNTTPKTKPQNQKAAERLNSEFRSEPWGAQCPPHTAGGLRWDRGSCSPRPCGRDPRQSVMGRGVNVLVGILRGEKLG